MINVMILFGGNSPEHEVSLRSASTVFPSASPETAAFTARRRRKTVSRFPSPKKNSSANR